MANRLPVRSAISRSRLSRQKTAVSPYAAHEIIGSGEIEEPVDPIEFVVSDRYLNRPNLFPRQATLLKIIFLRDDMFTQFDHDVIGEWIEEFSDHEADGIQPDIYDRITINNTCPCGHSRWDHNGHLHPCRIPGCQCQRYDGRRWFGEVVFAGGRRGSKGHVGGLCGAYVLWRYLKLRDPQHYFGVDRDKRLTSITFAGLKEQAKANQWRDIFNVVRGGPCFAPYISKAQTERLTVYAPHDFYRMEQFRRRGIAPDDDIATFEIIPAPSTLMAGRGPTSFMQHYDEFAHVVAAGANSDAEGIWTTATPSLDQFGQWAFIYEGSSPWQMTGQFYTNWQNSLAVGDDGSPKYPRTLMCQLPSWALYEDWERAKDLPIRAPRRIALPGATPPAPGQLVATRLEPSAEVPRFQPLRKAIMEFDAEMALLEEANPETFRVERRARWAAALNAYLNEAKVKAVFEDWGSHHFSSGAMQHSGAMSVAYKAHGDPSKSNKNFGWAIGHTETDGAGLKHVVFDVLHAWRPQDFPDHIVDYIQIENEIFEYGKRFMPFELTCDQWNSVGTLQRLNSRFRRAKLPKQITVFEKTATAPLNWSRAETFKTAVNLGLVHGPYFELAELELRFLQDLGNKKVDHPTSGPVQTKDVADAMFEVVHVLIGQQIEDMLADLGSLRLGMTAPGGSGAHETAGGNDYAAQFAAATQRRPRSG